MASVGRKERGTAHRQLITGKGTEGEGCLALVGKEQENREPPVAGVEEGWRNLLLAVRGEMREYGDRP